MLRWLWCLLVVMVLALVGGAYSMGRVDERRVQSLASLKADTELKAARLDAQQQAIRGAAALAERDAARAAWRAGQDKAVIREVVKYVDREAAADPAAVVWLDAGWVRVHDAATGQAGVAGASAGSVGGAEAVTAGRALDVVTGNYAQCLAWRDQVVGWQEWYAMVRGADE